MAPSDSSGLLLTFIRSFYKLICRLIGAPDAGLSKPSAKRTKKGENNCAKKKGITSRHVYTWTRVFENVIRTSEKIRRSPAPNRSRDEKRLTLVDKERVRANMKVIGSRSASHVIGRRTACLIWIVHNLATDVIFAWKTHRPWLVFAAREPKSACFLLFAETGRTEQSAHTHHLPALTTIDLMEQEQPPYALGQRHNTSDDDESIVATAPQCVPPLRLREWSRIMLRAPFYRRWSWRLLQNDFKWWLPASDGARNIISRITLWIFSLCKQKKDGKKVR